MLKARFIDKILEALGYEAGKIKIFDNTFLTYFYDDRSEEEKEKIIEKAQEEFNQFEYGFFQWGDGSRYGDKTEMLERMSEISKEISELRKNYNV